MPSLGSKEANRSLDLQPERQTVNRRIHGRNIRSGDPVARGRIFSFVRRSVRGGRKQALVQRVPRVGVNGVRSVRKVPRPGVKGVARGVRTVSLFSSLLEKYFVKIVRRSNLF